MQRLSIYISLILSAFLIILYINYRVSNNNLIKEDVTYAVNKIIDIEPMDNPDSELTDQATDLVFHEDWRYLTSENQITINSYTLDILSNIDTGTIYIMKKGKDNYDRAASFSLPISGNIEYSISESGYYKVILIEDKENKEVTDITSKIGIGHCAIIK